MARKRDTAEEIIGRRSESGRTRWISCCLSFSGGWDAGRKPPSVPAATAAAFRAVAPTGSSRRFPPGPVGCPNPIRAWSNTPSPDGDAVLRPHRYYPMRAFGDLAATAQCCTTFAARGRTSTPPGTAVTQRWVRDRSYGEARTPTGIGRAAASTPRQ